MSVAAGITLSLISAATIAWAGFGDRIARLPTVARITEYLDGGFRMPSEKQVDELMLAANRRREAGILDYDDMLAHGLCTHGEDLATLSVRPLISEAAIEDALRRSRGLTEQPVNGGGKGPNSFMFPAIDPLRGFRGWLLGGYNMPTDAQITAAAPHTLRGRELGAIDDVTYFADEQPDAIFRPNPTGLGGNNGEVIA